jgi:formate dehydrogenase subunit gamma
MRTMTKRVGAALALLAAVLVLGLADGPAAAQQVNPTELSVQEEAVLNALQRGDAVAGRVSIPNPRAGDLIKPGGRDWSDLHRSTMFGLTVWTLVGMAAILAIFYLVRGRIRIESGRSGRSILRFNGLERFTHWLTAVTFIVLALTGLNLVIGQYTLLPLFGEGAFGTVSAWGKLAHNYLAWPFMLGIVLIFLVWVRDNIPSRVDGEWLRQGGGLFSKGKHPPARRFNAGQKMIFWSVVIGGAVLSFTGVILIFPDLAGTSANWQLMQVVHGVAAAIMTAIILAHIYLGSVGMEGAYDAMGSGEVDLNWAKEHHSLWVEEQLGASEAHSHGGAAGRPVAPAE